MACSRRRDTVTIMNGDLRAGPYLFFYACVYSLVLFVNLSIEAYELLLVNVIEQSRLFFECLHQLFENPCFD